MNAFRQKIQTFYEMPVLYNKNSSHQTKPNFYVQATICSAKITIYRLMFVYGCTIFIK